ncbi:hypothetical protein [Patulibacter sp.]|uniref:hypothetical protein n=1 Tax=Patulibacter sp. TaxID=1912859 RepID=UPI00271E0160|nr:hypothetical protein [Patulibacter sp.]MDO9408545.1 hypothetical protein [Patulibacter sp.]
MEDQDALVRRIARHEFPDPRVVPVRDRDGAPTAAPATPDATRLRADPAEIRRAEDLVRDVRGATARD